MGHAPVLLQEAMDALALKDGGLYIDATFGGGGYSREMLARARCRVIAYDRDPDALARGTDMARDRFTLLQGRFGDLSADEPVDGVVFDLGVSSFQLDQAERGFSFRSDADLDMRMEKQGPSAADAVNKLSEPALAELIYRYGEDDDSRRIARAIVQERAAHAITRTGLLAHTIERAVGGRKGARVHPATKTFQALRMLVNDELGELARGLSAAERVLAPAGRLVVVSFHSLEDRMVKQFMRRHSLADPMYAGLPNIPVHARPKLRLVGKAIEADDQEIALNPRSRSAHLRVAERLDQGLAA